MDLGDPDEAGPAPNGKRLVEPEDPTSRWIPPLNNKMFDMITWVTEGAVRLKSLRRSFAARPAADHAARSTARENTSSSITSVNRPVNVFCWLT